MPEDAAGPRLLAPPRSLVVEATAFMEVVGIVSAIVVVFIAGINGSQTPSTSTTARSTSAPSKTAARATPTARAVAPTPTLAATSSASGITSSQRQQVAPTSPLPYRAIRRNGSRAGQFLELPRRQR